MSRRPAGASARWSSSSITPSSSRSVCSGMASTDRGTYPVASATSAAKRGSRATSATATGWPEDTTQPAMPRSTGTRWPTTSWAPAPEATWKVRVS